jgi:hypothetical protein
MQRVAAQPSTTPETTTTTTNFDFIEFQSIMTCFNCLKHLRNKLVMVVVGLLHSAAVKERGRAESWSALWFTAPIQREIFKQRNCLSLDYACATLV